MTGQKRKWTTGLTSPRKASKSILHEFAPAPYRIDLENYAAASNEYKAMDVSYSQSSQSTSSK